jgi:CheY-like chemotaxis protein
MPKILVVEDNQLTRITLDRFLRSQGYEVELAEDGAQAISLLDRNEFDLVLSDVMMPNLNGWDLADHLNSVLPETPVLLMTAYAQLQSAQSALRSPPEVVLKPLQLSDLLAKIRQKLDQKKSN